MSDGHAPEPHATPRLPLAPGHLLRLRTPATPAISPDGRSVAFALAEWLPGQPRQRWRLWLVEASGGEPLPLTMATGDERAPCWSPDGATLAFVASRAASGGEPGTLASGSDAAQLHSIAASGGTPRRLTALPSAVSAPAWAPDGASLTFLAPDGPSPGDDPVVAAPGRRQRLWRVSREGTSPHPLTPENATIWEYAWSPDGRWIAVYFSVEPDETAWYRGAVGIVPAPGGAIRPLAQPHGQAAALAWSPDGTRIAYVSGEWSDRGLVGGDLYVVGREGGDPRNLTPDAPLSVSWCAWLPDGLRLLMVAWDGVTNSIALLDERSGERTPLAPDFVLGEGHWPHPAATPNLRTLVATHSDATHAPDLWLGQLTAHTGHDPSLSWRRLTTLNALAEETWAVTPSQRVRYAGAKGWEITALLTPPRAPTHGTPPPLVVNVHGGPSTAWRDDFAGGPWTQLLASAGFAVLRANIRGSLGRGVAFADAVLGDMGGDDLADLLAGIEWLAGQGLVDASRVGIAGWSYGGFMAAWAITQTRRFKAAVVGAGISDFHSFHAQSNIPDWDMRFLRAEPLGEPEAYRARSAITLAARIATPTLILHGERDACVPINQAHALYRALRERVVPVEFAAYPREGHGFEEREHIRDRDERVVRWLTRWLG